MKKTFATVLALAGVAMGAPLLEVDFTAVTEVPAGWTTGQWNGVNTPHYQFGENGATVNYP